LNSKFIVSVSRAMSWRLLEKTTDKRKTAI